MDVLDKLLDRLVDNLTVQYAERCVVRGESSDACDALILLEAAASALLACKTWTEIKRGAPVTAMMDVVREEHLDRSVNV